MATSIDLEITGVRGTSPKMKSDIGRATVFVNDDTLLRDDYISVDAFQGLGTKREFPHNPYKRRESAEITIHYAGKEWKGTIAQLAEELQII